MTPDIQDSIIVDALAHFHPIAYGQAGRSGQLLGTDRATNKLLYKALRSSCKAVPTKPYRWPDIDHATLGKAFYRNHQSHCAGSVKQFRWLILTHSLPVRARLVKMSMPIQPSCPICGVTETIVHRVSECTQSRLVIQWISHTWRSMTQEVLPIRDSMFWVKNLPESQFHTQIAELIDVALYRCWINRNKHVFQPGYGPWQIGFFRFPFPTAQRDCRNFI